MYQHKPRRFRSRSNGRRLHSRNNGDMNERLRDNSFSNDKTRNHFRTPQSAEKLLEKYNTLAKEALSSGDKTLSENYFQHADHFIRIIENKNINQKQNSVRTDDKLVVNAKPLVENSSVNPLVENSSVNQDNTTTEKEEKKE